MKKTNEQIATQVSWVTIVLNILLSGVKLAAGVFSNSAAMLSDGVHSLSDVLSTFIVIISVKMANKKADKEHPYGHERFECVAALLLAAMLCITGVGIGYGGLHTIFQGNCEAVTVPGLTALAAAIASIIIKEGMYWYTRNAAKKINSGALMADAWHHRSDAFSSVGSLLGILGARLGFPILDSVACLVICLFIIKVSFDIFMNTIRKMTDHACDDDTVEEVRALILEQKDVQGIDLLRTRLFGDKICIDVEINVSSDITLIDSHEIAHAVHDAIGREILNVKHCMVHVNPHMLK